MFFVIALALIFQKIGKHRAALHIVAVDDQVRAGQTRDAAVVHEGQAALGLFFVVVAMQVIFFVVYGLHDGIIDIGSVYTDPADYVGIEIVECPVLG